MAEAEVPGKEDSDRALAILAVFIVFGYVAIFLTKVGSAPLSVTPAFIFVQNQDLLLAAILSLIIGVFLIVVAFRRHYPKEKTGH